MFYTVKLKRFLCLTAVIFLLAGGGFILYHTAAARQTNTEAQETPEATAPPAQTTAPEKKDYIKWVDFNVPYEVMDAAMKADIKSRQEDIKLNWVELLSYLGAKNGGNFSSFKKQDLDKLVDKLKGGATMEDLTKDMKYYSYYRNAYGAVLDGLVGEYSIEKPLGEGQPSEWVDTYGLKAFSPIAKGYYYNDFDDFGTSRDYGYKRKHLGHDLMAQIGTPVVAVESGTIEAVGWNQYGGWRIGIRSFDKKRYYYYAHLRKNHPYNEGITEGTVVKAGDVIGYVGRTGYSTNENVNNITQPHLHFGIQLIFDESQKEGNNEIWIDCYQIIKLLAKNKVAVVKNEQTKEYSRVFDFREPSLPPEQGT